MGRALHAINKLWLFLICIALPQSVLASHAQGGQLTYESLGNNQYRITCGFFRDCSGEKVPEEIRLDYRASGTGCVDLVPLSGYVMVPQKGPTTLGNPYCTALGAQAPCDPRKATNYQTAQYQTTLTLPPNAEWRLFVTIASRPEVANLPGGFSHVQPLHFEATLRTLINNTALENTSPQFLEQDIPVPFVCWRQPTTLTFSATEPDGDSLAYDLADPMAGCEEPLGWGLYPGSVDATNPQCQVIDPGGNYSARFPIPSFKPGTCAGGNALAVPNFRINDFNRSVTFRPALYTPGLETAKQAQNKYVMVVQIKEYRFLEGQWVLIGSVRRDMLVIVMDCQENQVPNPPLATAAPAPEVHILNSDSTLIEVPAGRLTMARLDFTDPNPDDQLTVTTPELAPSVPSITTPEFLPVGVGSLVLTANKTSHPIAQLLLQPDARYIGKTFRIPFRIEDNACPAKAVQNRVVVVRVVPALVAKPFGAYNVFTPNGDARNDTFVFDSLPNDCQLRIFNRWGRLVRQYSHYQNNWTGDGQPSGLYYYILTPPNAPATKGWVQLIR
ncbi:gliding motility-associated C-terminal domain-containing protein [Hymenobacter sp. BT730]|uniref:gliding motility-associated C-terminal domain-containing protein n=1 Tax=Hymenobacter sp. BT730 TaxID=3063332 RepID=UPI0026DED81F|nr:gliding motility-associated C-terminal domain-containing protein [Hymenobacter sp. BT730]